MLNNRAIWKVIACGMMSAVLFSCIEDNPASTVDPLPLPAEIEANKDLSVSPGDSFFDYCNGSWIKSTAIPAQGAVGGLYDQEPAMEKRLEQLKKSVPDVGHFYELMEASSGQPEKTKAYLDAQKARFPRPKTKAEAFETMGRLMAEGINMWPNPIMPTYYLMWKDGKLLGTIVPNMDIIIDVPTEWNPAEFIPVCSTKADGAESAEALILKGLGADPAMFITNPAWAPFWTIMENYTLEKLCSLIDDAWKYYDDLGIEELTAASRTNARSSLNYTLSYHFQQQYISAAFKEKYVGITREIQASLKKRLEKVDWMSETTRNNAIDKLENYSLYVAYPDKWYLDCVSELSGCETLAEAVLLNNRNTNKLKSHLLGGTDAFSNMIISTLYSGTASAPADLTLVNAMYSPANNAVFIYPAVLLPPFVPDNVSQAYEYAAFVAIGHEFTHGFDNQGSQYDKWGNKVNWWTVADKMAFEERRDKIVSCYSHLELDPKRLPGVYGNGDRTQGENIADLGGFLTVLDAYEARLEADGYKGENYDAQLRKFYECFAHCWCVQYSDAKLNDINQNDAHSHARLRINGVVMNTDLWYELYNVDRNSVLYLPAERRTYIW